MLNRNFKLKQEYLVAFIIAGKYVFSIMIKENDSSQNDLDDNK